MAEPQAQAVADWTFGLFGCFEEIGLCLISWVVPCVTFGNIAEALGEDCLLYGLSLLVPLLNLYCVVSVRGRVRDKYQIPGSVIGDCLTMWCCGLCALVQEARQVQRPPPGEQVQRA